MEVVVMVCFLVVPFISVGALIMALINNKRFKALKELVMELTRLQGYSATPQQQAVNDFVIGQM